MVAVVVAAVVSTAADVVSMLDEGSICQVLLTLITLMAITLSISGVRHSPSDSRNLSSISFKKRPFETQITITNKIIS